MHDSYPVYLHDSLLIPVVSLFLFSPFHASSLHLHLIFISYPHLFSPSLSSCPFNPTSGEMSLPSLHRVPLQSSWSLLPELSIVYGEVSLTINLKQKEEKRGRKSLTDEKRRDATMFSSQLIIFSWLLIPKPWESRENGKELLTKCDSLCFKEQIKNGRQERENVHLLALITLSFVMCVSSFIPLLSPFY